MRITKVTDPVTQTVMAYTIEGVFGRNDRIIWMDGRPRPPENAEHTWDGFSTGKLEGNRLTVTTTHMKYGVIQRNGVPAAPDAVMTEHFIRHGDYLTLVRSMRRSGSTWKSRSSALRSGCAPSNVVGSALRGSKS